ncbi:hypothetical protein Leryth_024485 [Lithospermum erythrorhizon]|nr:hypothetical protein Leryth_024485 [Lithospermum erythrorhizon]
MEEKTQWTMLKQLSIKCDIISYVVSCTRMSARKWTLASTLQKWRKGQF